ncbi:hypothetical protein SERLADRAFT_458154 [Serpula lacrymans var. lacrymans S7.9]|uniref:Uncharacterized protein n=1 Tax=Serpula lacrymans var. lacrymans (strain S7.9) TaxID=578457 RepID=F8NJE8_SERL9|nr:uncharacterized protein SERLADRAFT_458154 [Serpula lacrymans var. lacrymans S7.9]EGO29846.1 hypothetical protein SERLADRAFT_458154 [Serpula lacrymans var. lacrymans S7.9]
MQATGDGRTYTDDLLIAWSRHEVGMPRWHSFHNLWAMLIRAWYRYNRIVIAPLTGLRQHRVCVPGGPW